MVNVYVCGILLGDGRSAICALGGLRLAGKEAGSQIANGSSSVCEERI